MNNNFKTKRLTKDNTKSKNSYQNSLSPKEIKEKLEEYKRVEDVNALALNTHLRYFTVNPKTGEKQFRLGGFLTKIDASKGYVVLSNGQLSWSVQLANTIFFKKMTFQELKKELIEDIGKVYIDEIKALKEENRVLKDTIKKVKKEFEKKSSKNSKKSSKKSSKNK